MSKKIILNMTGSNYDTKKPIIETLIAQCNTGDFKLKDHIFSEVCEAYKMNEDDVMQLMCDVPQKIGEFTRSSDGWLFREK